MLKNSIRFGLLIFCVQQQNCASPGYFAGTFDTNFNASGVQPGTLQTYINDQPGNAAVINTVLVQADDKIVASGYIQTDQSEFAIARFNYNGSLDTTFNSTGAQPGTLTLSNIGGNTSNNQISGSVLQSDGKIVVAGKRVMLQLVH